MKRHTAIWVKQETKQQFLLYKNYEESQDDTFRKILAYAIKGGLKPYYTKI